MGVFHGRLALVTGATRRIGFCIAERLAQEGFALALHCSLRSEREAAAACRHLQAKGTRAALFAADLADAQAVETLVPRVIESMGALDLLVNNASIFEDDSIGDLAAAKFDRHMGINLRAPLVLASAFAAQAERAGDPSIVNILDQRVWRLNPRYFSYTLSKSALWTATQTLAQALAPHIRVNGVGPGPSLRNAMQTPADFAAEAAATPLGRAVAPHDVADAVLYLTGARAVTGQMIAVDSGQHLAWQTPDVMRDEG